MLKLVVILMLLAVVGSLVVGLIFLYRDQGNGERMAKALTLRVVLSVAIFVLLLLSFRFGLIPGYIQ